MFRGVLVSFPEGTLKEGGWRNHDFKPLFTVMYFFLMNRFLTDVHKENPEQKLSFFGLARGLP